MKTLEFKIDIQATAKKIWQVLWSDSTYRQWTSPFCEGSYAVSDWKEGSKVQFLSPEGSGIFGIIAECKPAERMVFKHLGELKNFKEEPDTEESRKWSGALESYSFWPKFRKVAARIPFASDALSVWWCARDPTTPMAAKGMMLAGLAYFVLPTDAIPDLLPVIGFTDDAAVIAALIAIVGKNLKPRHRAKARAFLDRLVADD